MIESCASLIDCFLHGDEDVTHLMLTKIVVVVRKWECSFPVK